MTIHLELSNELAPTAAGDQLALTSGGDIRAALDALEARYPGVKARICDVSGNIRRTLRIFADGADIRFLDNLETRLGDGARLTIVPLRTAL